MEHGWFNIFIEELELLAKHEEEEYRYFMETAFN